VGLIDAGLTADAAEIRAALARMNKSPVDVRAILLTHGHNDHDTGALAFPGAAVYVMNQTLTQSNVGADRTGGKSRLREACVMENVWTSPAPS
jgi:glyoxylase-like metal-dependent hydrolase (beta-lactamase superfamily II)